MIAPTLYQGLNANLNTLIGITNPPEKQRSRRTSCFSWKFQRLNALMILRFYLFRNCQDSCIDSC